MQRRQALLAKRYAGRILPPHPTGHGETTYIPVKQTNMLASEDGRDARRAVMLDRDRKRQQYIAGLSKPAVVTRKERPRPVFARHDDEPAPRMFLRRRKHFRITDSSGFVVRGAGGFHKPQARKQRAA